MKYFEYLYLDLKINFYLTNNDDKANLNLIEYFEKRISKSFYKTSSRKEFLYQVKKNIQFVENQKFIVLFVARDKENKIQGIWHSFLPRAEYVYKKNKLTHVNFWTHLKYRNQYQSWSVNLQKPNFSFIQFTFTIMKPNKIFKLSNISYTCEPRSTI